LPWSNVPAQFGAGFSQPVYGLSYEVPKRKEKDGPPFLWGMSCKKMITQITEKDYTDFKSIVEISLFESV
jgi:hypothetical protein